MGQIDADSDVCDFIDQYISCEIPKEEAELVLLLQQHKHSSYCKRHNSCRVDFPKPLSHKTLITKAEVEPDTVSVAQHVLTKVYRVLACGHDLRLDDLLVKAEVSIDDYMEALEVSNAGNVVVLKREPCECYINESTKVHNPRRNQSTGAGKYTEIWPTSI